MTSKETPWSPVSHLPGYEERFNEKGYRETRPIESAAPIAPAAVSESTDKLAQIGSRLNWKEYCGYSEQAHGDIAYLLKHIANLESELQIARDLITWKDARIAELERQLTAANFGSTVQRERYGTF